MSSRIAELRAKGRRAKPSVKQPDGSNGNGHKYDSDSRYANRDKFGSFGLTRRQAMFVLEFVTDPTSQTQAAIAAGYSPHSAHVQASQLLANPNVAAAITAMQERLRMNTEVTAEEIVGRLSAIAFDPRPNPRSADQVKALELLGKYLGFDVADNTNVQLVVHFDEDRLRLYPNDNVIDMRES